MKKTFMQHRKKILIIAVIVLISIGAGIYYFAWRLSDKDYQGLSDNLGILDKTQVAVKESLKKIQSPSDLTDDSVSNLEKQAKQYTAALGSSLNSVVLSRDAKTNEAFNNSKAQLSAYDGSLNDLVDSLKQYRLVVNWCSEAISQASTYSTVLDFNAAADGCEGALNSAKSASYVAFNEQFLSKYIDQYPKLLDAYRTEIGRAKPSSSSFSYKNIDPIVKELDSLYGSPLNLTLTIDVGSPLKSISTTVASQKASIFR